jgi:hypothetical protein
VYLGTPYGVPVAGTACWVHDEVLGAPVKGAIADHRGGDAYGEDARFGS